MKLTAKETETIKYYQDKLFAYAIKEAKKKKCKKCDSKDKWNIVPLYEHNPFIPSQMILYCKKCRRHESLTQIKKFMETIQESVKKMSKFGLDDKIITGK